MDAVELKTKARELGIDLIGIAPRSRWENLPPEENPLSIMPECQSVIVIGRKILRGLFRGIEEGTNFYSTYALFGKQWNEFSFLSRIVFNLANVIEATGAEAMPLTGGMTKGENCVIGNAGIVGNAVIDTKKMAHLAGLGSIGKGGFFLTKQYGHRQRFAMILTDMVLDGDNVIDLDFCNGCDACLKACPLNALADNGTDAFSMDTERCRICGNGRSTASELAFEPLDRLASSCGRACMIALEDKIDEKFHNKFRKRAVWTRDLYGKATVTPLAEGDK